ncbi:hypothetical protein DPMN_172896 [Dreissena polymorpha]|uniref:Uncharacterized protein n=1 Tax=Dreissena polymorpha TaxID=45954 RepID=A0A9D4E1P7_DREPO|nr:hypothetical protein DPMN_172896 [Dreissena polymorpha]
MVISGDKMSRRSNRSGLYMDSDEERRTLFINEKEETIIQQWRQMEAKTQNAVLLAGI